MEEISKPLKNITKYDIRDDRDALLILNHILTNGTTAEVYIGKHGLVIREIKRKLKYDRSQRQ